MSFKVTCCSPQGERDLAWSANVTRRQATRDCTLQGWYSPICLKAIVGGRLGSCPPGKNRQLAGNPASHTETAVLGQVAGGPGTFHPEGEMKPSLGFWWAVEGLYINPSLWPLLMQEAPDLSPSLVSQHPHIVHSLNPPSLAGGPQPEPSS